MMFILAKRGKAPTTITVPEDDPRIRDHARELQRVLKIMTAVELPVANEPASGGEIALKIDPALLKKFARRKPVVREVVAWECDGRRRLTLSGSCPHALWLSLYAFLEEMLGCRWFFPGADGEDIPACESPSIAAMAVVKTPSFITRMLHHHKKDPAWPESFQRKKLGGGPDLVGVHNYSKIVPLETLKKHPEYGIMIRGKRVSAPVTQRCLSQKGVEDLAVAYCLDYFEKHPEETVVGVSPDDTENFCDCPRCVETNLGRKPARGEASPHWVTRSVFEFSSRVAARVASVYPDKLVLTIAYARTKKPMPGLAIHDNVLVDYCSQPATNWQGRGARRRLESDIAGWTRCARQVGIFDYIVNKSWPGLVRPLTGILSHALPLFYRKGVRYYYSQLDSDFGNNMVNYYLMCALLWDAKQDPDAVLSDFYRRCFRKAAPAVRRYFEIMEAAIMRWAETGPGPGTVSITGHRNAHEATCVIYGPEVMAAGGTALERAARLAAKDPVAEKRLALVRKAFDHLEITVTACRLTCAFVEKYRIKSFTPWAWNVGNYDYHNTLEKMEIFGKPCVDELRAVTKAWTAYRKSRNRLEKEMVISGRFGRGGRSFDPKETLDNLWGLYHGKIKSVPPLVTARSAMRAM